MIATVMQRRRHRAVCESFALREWARHRLTPTPETVWDLAPDEPDNLMRVCRNDDCERWFPLPEYRSGLPTTYCSVECKHAVEQQRRNAKAQVEGWNLYRRKKAA